MLHANYHDMTRWDVYKSEVESGHLQWGIVHTEKFFKENARRMEGTDGNFAIVKVRMDKVIDFLLERETAYLGYLHCNDFDLLH